MTRPSAAHFQTSRILVTSADTRVIKSHGIIQITRTLRSCFVCLVSATRYMRITIVCFGGINLESFGIYFIQPLLRKKLYLIFSWN